MLELKKISKVYQTADLRQVALNDVSISFRKSEFAAILGQSGSGKTTLLNIIGGLDQYTTGDLIINKVSTKKYKDRDWDSYRNHRVGFIFQSYNLISHQSILRNVELALTLSGVSKSERVKKAKAALKEVGLERHMNKKPNQLSGGQMQRVAIARALINDPDIILADEPTGALDTATSKQIMDLLKKIAKDKLVIMVTHNPELANIYSTRIIKLSDGKIIDDTNPYNDKKEKVEEDQKKKTKKTSMSFITALSLSLNNLLTKKGRTILTAFAGSIGIIGIALILSLSNGFQNYIDKLQEDTLSSYPLVIENETMDFSSLLISMMDASNVEDVKKGKVVETQQFASMFSSVTTNDLKSFKEYLEENEKRLSKDVSAISYNYSVDPNIYTTYKGKVVQVNPNSIFNSMFGGSSIMSSFSSESSMFMSYTDEEMEDLKKDYQIMEGRWPENYNEMILVLPSENAIPDLLLYMMGIRDMDELYDIMSKVMTGEKVSLNNKPMEFKYSDFLNLEYKLIPRTSLYKYNKKYKIYEDMKDDEKFVKNLYNNAESIKVVGVLAPKENVTRSGMSGGFVYKQDLVKHIIDDASKTDIVKKQLANEKVDVFSNKKFDDKKKKTNLNFDDFIKVDTKMLQSAFGMDINENDIKNMTSGYMDDINKSINEDTRPKKEEVENTFKNTLLGYFKYVESNPKSTIEMFGQPMPSLKSVDVSSTVEEYFKTVKMDDLTKTMYKQMISVSLEAAITEMGGEMPIVEMSYKTFVDTLMSNEVFLKNLEDASIELYKGKMQMEVLTKVGELTQTLIGEIASSFKVDGNKIAKAFKFNMNENEMGRLLGAMGTKDNDATALTNLINLGYQDLDKPTSISIKFHSFEGKQNFQDEIKKYNKKAKRAGEKDKEINYVDATGILMSSVKKIVDSVSYVLIAFVSISLIVSSIMIGIITYISVLERTKEIGILRAIGASKNNISSIFNAETFIIGLLSGLIGIGFTLSVIPGINKIIHTLTNNYDINASIPVVASIVLITLSVILTLIGGLIPSRIASKKDPVEALRTE